MPGLGGGGGSALADPLSAFPLLDDSFGEVVSSAAAFLTGSGFAAWARAAFLEGSVILGDAAFLALPVSLTAALAGAGFRAGAGFLAAAFFNGETVLAAFLAGTTFLEGTAFLEEAAFLGEPFTGDFFAGGGVLAVFLGAAVLAAGFLEAMASAPVYPSGGVGLPRGGGGPPPVEMAPQHRSAGGANPFHLFKLGFGRSQHLFKRTEMTKELVADRLR